MTIAEADDFLAETRELADVLGDISTQDFSRVTAFKGWMINDVIVHLHFWNLAVDLAASDEAAFAKLISEITAEVAKGGGRAFENARIPERGQDLRRLWLAHAEDMAPRWRAMDAKARIPWAGPSMSARSAMTARQMETWAHGFEVFDLLGVERKESDRLRNLVVLGVNTFGWSHQVQGLPIPPAMPELRLTSPSGALWTFGDASAGRISGSAKDFAAVVTQTRAFADTDLKAEGDVAETWMTHAQCFAGPREKPPAPGSRLRRAN